MSAASTAAGPPSSEPGLRGFVRVWLHPWRRPLRWALGIGAALLAMAAAVLTTGVLWPEAVPPVQRPAPWLAIEGVAVVDVAAGRVLAPRTVLIRGGRIVAVDLPERVAVPAEARRIDGRGRTLIPALWDMHMHLGKRSDLGDLALTLSYGVANVRDMMGCTAPDDPLIPCAEDTRRWTAEAVAGQRVGIRIWGATSYMANGPATIARVEDLPPFFATATAADGRAFARHHAGKVTRLKVYDRIPLPAYRALCAEAARLGLPVVGHRPLAVPAEEAAACQRSIEHPRFLLHESFPGAAALRARAGVSEGPGRWREDRAAMLAGHDPARAQAIFAAMRTHGTWYVPTHLTLWSQAYADTPQVRQDPMLRYLHPLFRPDWERNIGRIQRADDSPQARATGRAFHAKSLALTGAAHRAGVRVLVGSDYLAAGPAVHREMQLLVQAGLSPAEALRAATRAPAEYFGVQDHYGQIAPGAVADLVLLDADPLRDIANTQRIRAVVFAGAWYDRPALDAIQRIGAEQARSWTIGSKIVWEVLRNPTAY
jgi:imidazolonepropionase-like amidohydrolase